MGDTLSGAGYLSIYLVGLATGLYVLPPSPSFFRLHSRPSSSPSTPAEARRLADKRAKAADARKPREGRRAEWLGSAAVWYWAAWAVGQWVTPGGVSRRLVRRARFPLPPLPTGARKTDALPPCFPRSARACPVAPEQANAAYVLWTAAFNCSFLVLYLGVHHWASSSSSQSRGTDTAGGQVPLPLEPPRLFEAVNRNGLVVFLVVRSASSLSSPPRTC